MNNLSLQANKRAGVAILYAVLLVSVVLTISLSLLNITYKEIIITAVSRDSQIAHFNAWSAVDCIISANKAFKEGDGFGSDLPLNPFGFFVLQAPEGLYPSTDPGEAGDLDPIFTCGAGNEKKIEIRVDEPSSNSIESIGENAQGVSGRYNLTGPGLREACAIVDVAKVLDGNYADFPQEDFTGAAGNDQGHTMIFSRGYNIIDPCLSGSIGPRLVERQVSFRIPGDL